MNPATAESSSSTESMLASLKLRTIFPPGAVVTCAPPLAFRVVGAVVAGAVAGAGCAKAGAATNRETIATTARARGAESGFRVERCFMLLLLLELHRALQLHA